MNKEGWQIKTLGDIADVKGGKRVPKGYKLQSVPTKYPYITVSDFTDEGTIDTSDLRYVSREVFEQIKRYTISSNDLYLSIAGTIGKTGYVPIELDGASLTENACKLVLRPGIDRNFVYYFTKSDGFTTQAGTNTRTAAQPKLALERLKTIKLPIPLSFPEQQRIVGLLDEAFAGLATAQANAEKNLQNARALFESHLQSVFTQRGEGWVEKHLKEVCEKITDGTHQTPKYFDEGTVFLSSRNVTSGVIDWDRIKYIDTKQHLEMHRRVAPRRDDILLAKNGTTGVAAIVDRDTTFDIYVSLALLRALPVIRPRLLLQFINSPAAKIQFNKRLKGVGVPNLHLEEIREVRVAFPSDLGEQDRVIAGLDDLHTETQRLQTLYQQKLAALDELKKSLLQQAFSGAL